MVKLFCHFILMDPTVLPDTAVGLNHRSDSLLRNKAEHLNHIYANLIATGLLLATISHILVKQRLIIKQCSVMASRLMCRTHKYV